LLRSKDNIRKKALIFSILLHILLFTFLQKAKDFNFSKYKNIIHETVDDRLVFELVEIPEQIREETPEEESNLVSDKNTKAADLVENGLPDTETPFQTGNVAFPEYQEPNYEVTEKSGSQLENPTDILSELKKNKKSFLETFQTNKEMQKVKSNDAEYKNLLSQVKNHGGMSLNTYHWDFAPYMLAMKNKVENNINPPFAFTKLGAIKGNILVRFKVLSNGKVTDLEIIKSNAHYSLDQTSIRAICLSDPFLPLPENFPEKYLEITALFSYIIKKFYKE